MNLMVSIGSNDSEKLYDNDLGAVRPSRHETDCAEGWLRSFAVSFVLLLVASLSAQFEQAYAQNNGASTGKEVAERLQRSVDNPDQEDNIYHNSEAVNSPEQVLTNMRKLFRNLLVSEVRGKVDKAYNPHLRDIGFPQGDKQEMANTRKLAGAIATIRVPILNCYICLNKFGFKTACDLCNTNPCPGFPRWPDSHIHRECCQRPFPIDTSVYEKFTRPSNFKACCVKNEQVFDSEELIACKSKHPLYNPNHFFKFYRGDGWAGLTEADFWMTAFGLENARATSMIATETEVRQCLADADRIMEGSQSATWIREAIERNAEWGDRAGGGGGPEGGQPDRGDLLAKVNQDIRPVRPSGANQKLRFSDSLLGSGLTVRPNVAVMAERSQLARHFCFRPEQFSKLMDPVYDPLQLEGGPDWRRDLMNPRMLWANYCANGTELMTNPALSDIANEHRTSTDFKLGMQAWRRDPLYCQRIQSTQNQNFMYFGFDKVLQASQAGVGVPDAQSVGYTCMEGGKLNTGMVPVTFLRNGVVERRTAIADRVFGFIIAGTLAQQPAMFQRPLKSLLKGFEPRPYSFRGPQPPNPAFETFIGKRFAGGGTNELGDVCETINGDDYQYQNRSDGLHLSDYTHQPFTDQYLFNSQKAGQGGGLDTAFNKYVQQWAKNDVQSQKQIAKRDIDRDGTNMSDTSRDRNVLNYGSVSRIIAVCPKDHKRWRPPRDAANTVLNRNLEAYCREENFGSPQPHFSPR